MMLCARSVAYLGGEGRYPFGEAAGSQPAHGASGRFSPISFR
jgi:hypothetical protein